jgi:DNA-binding CsgD family transcriptional regulator
VHGRLRAATPDITRRLAVLVEEAVQKTARRGGHPGGILFLPTNEGEPLRAMVSPAPRFAMVEPSALIFLGNPNTTSNLNPEHQVARLYGLTAAETKLLGALFKGERLADYAEASSISLNTAKTHLQRIFAKTGSTRQADLQRLFLSDPILRLGHAPDTNSIPAHR